ncbi:MAG: nucleoside hydrolase [Cyclobacteriaceae bacterium]
MISSNAQNIDKEKLPKIIIDTDLRSDVDDAGTLALANALADMGECELIGVVASQTGPFIVGAINAINTWYGRSEVPIGLSPKEDLRFDDHYAPEIGNPDNYPISQKNSTATESTTLYRRLLKNAPDNSVKIVVIGGQTPLRLLLDSKANHEGDGSINQTGRELVKAKVSGLYLMAGNFTDPDHAEHNIMLDREASQHIAENWPTTIIYSGFEIGRQVITGGNLSNPDQNPVSRAYQLFPAGGVGNISGSSSYDQTILYFAVRGAEAGDIPLWTLSEPGTVSFPEGKTVFKGHPKGKHRYLKAKAPYETVAKVIDSLMVQAPKLRP